MEGRKWEELPTDCLVDILGRVGMESRLLDIPFVCKSWYQASLSPLCWKQLDFSFLYEYYSFSSRYERLHGHVDFSKIKLIKDVVSRSAGCATSLKLASLYGEAKFSYVADNCPALKTLVLYSPDSSIMLEQSSVFGKFKNLEMLSIWRSGSAFKDIVFHIGAHCHNFTTLNLISDRYNNASFGEDEVMAVVNCLPKLKALTLNWVRIKRENLIKLLNGCLGLVHLDVSDCYGFNENDEELLKLASHIPTFKSSGSFVYSYGGLSEVREDEDEDDDCYYPFAIDTDSDESYFCDEDDNYYC